MYPAARLAILLIWLVALLAFVGAIGAGLAALDLFQLREQVQKQLPEYQHLRPPAADDESDEAKAQRTALRDYYAVTAAGSLVGAILLLIFADMVRAVINTAVNTRKTLVLLREQRAAPRRQV